MTARMTKGRTVGSKNSVFAKCAEEAGLPRAQGETLRKAYAGDTAAFSELVAQINKTHPAAEDARDDGPFEPSVYPTFGNTDHWRCIEEQSDDSRLAQYTDIFSGPPEGRAAALLRLVITYEGDANWPIPRIVVAGMALELVAAFGLWGSPPSASLLHLLAKVLELPTVPSELPRQRAGRILARSQRYI